MKTAFVFGIGEQVYLNHKNCEAKGLEKDDYKKQYNRMAKENLENAWVDFGVMANELLPNVKLYACTWGW